MAVRKKWNGLRNIWLGLMLLSPILTAQESLAENALLGYFQRLRSVPGLETEYVLTQPGTLATRSGAEKFLAHGGEFRRQWIPAATAPAPFSEQGFTLSLSADAHQILLQHVLQSRTLAASRPILGGGQGESFDAMADPVLLRPWQWLGGDAAGNTPNGQRNLAWYDIFDAAFLHRQLASCAPQCEVSATVLTCTIAAPAAGGLSAATVVITCARDLPWPDLALPMQIEWCDNEGTVQRTAHFRYRAFPCPDGSTLPLLEHADFVAAGKDSSEDLSMHLRSARILAATATFDLSIPAQQVRRRVDLDTGQPLTDPPAQIIRLEP